MNERILSLFEQAVNEFKEEHKYATIVVPNPLKEKFAELIVREVFAKIEDERFEVYQSVRESVMKHFGVEL